MLLPIIKRTRTPVRGTPNREALSMKQHRLFVVLTTVFGDLDRDSGHEQPIDIVAVPNASKVLILGGIDEHANRDASLECRDCRIGDRGISNAKHVDVEFCL